MTEQFPGHADALRDSVANWTRQVHRSFLLKDSLSVVRTAQDVIADLTSAGRVIVAESLRVASDVGLRMESVVIEENGDVVDTVVGADLMGHPARAVSWLANRLEDRDENLEAGDLVMTGGITAAIEIEPGDVFRVEFGTIGAITVRET